MRRHVAVDCVTRMVVTGVLNACFVAAALAAVQPTKTSVTITVFADRYILAGRVFNDVTLLAKDTTAMRARAVTLLACGPGETRSLKAAVYEFRHVPVEMRVLEADEPMCSTGVFRAVRVRERNVPGPYGIDDEAVERYWQDLMP